MLSSLVRNALDDPFKRSEDTRPAAAQRVPANMKTGIYTTILPAAVVIALVAIFDFVPASAQQPNEHGVQQTAFTRPASGDAAQRVTFSRQAAQVGDKVDQNISLEMRLTMNMRQGNQIVGKNQNTVRT